MLGIRRDVSLLLEKGHSQARLYPVRMLWNEAEICRDRDRIKLQALITTLTRVGEYTQSNLTDAGRKSAHKALNELYKDIGDGLFG